MIDNERLIIKNVIKGETQLFNILINEYLNSVFGIIFLYVKNKEISEDLTQETFIKAYKSVNTFKFKSSFKTWLIRIAINTVKDYLKNSYNKNNFTVMEFPDIPDYKNNPEKILEEIELKLFFDNVIKGMADKLKTVYILREQDNYSYEEIAAIIEKPIGTVESRLWTARKYIQRKFIKWAGL